MGPSKKPRGLVARIARGVMWTLVSGIVLIGLLGAAGFVFYQRTMNTDSLGVYEYAWRATKAYAFDQEALGDWKSFEHKYDAQIKNDDDAVKDANEMLATLHDPYTRLLTRSEVQAERQAARGNFAGIGVQFGMQSDKDGNPVKNQAGKPMMTSTDDGYPLAEEVIEGGPASAAGIQAGDAFLSVNGTSLQNAGADAVVNLIRGPAGTPANLVIRRGSQQLHIDLVRGIVRTPAVKTQQLDSDIGYIRLTSFEQDSTTDDMKAALKNLSASKAYVLDLRNNPGGRVDYVLKLVPMFLDQGRIVTIKEHVRGGGTETETYEVPGGNSENLTGGKPIIILINGNTASAAEMFTGALVDNGRAEAEGTTSFGKGIGQSVIPAPNGTELHVTSLRYYTPNGSWLGDGNSNKHGIKPTFTVTGPKVFKPLSDQDEQLKFAVDQLHKELAGGK
jgi:carboxyl-terminal processing protease